jgi:ABC-type polysaccharide/polyol phosphate export permease
MHSTPSALWNRRHLLHVLVTSNIKRQNKNSSLGYLWWLLDPLMMTGVYFVLVALIFDRGGTNQPFILFLVCGLLPWKAFAESLGQSTNALRGATGIIKAISFPKAVLPLAQVSANTFYLLVALIVPIGLALLHAPTHGTWPTAWYLLLPVVIFIQALLSLGLCMFLSIAGLFFADLQNIIRHLTRMWYFLSPGLYSIELVPEQWQTLYRLNPMVGVFTSYRDIIMHGRMPALIDLAYPLAVALIVLALGYTTLRKWEGKVVQHL